MWISALRFSSVLLACGSGLIACAAETDDEVMSSSEEDGEEVMSDEGLDSSADALLEAGRLAERLRVLARALRQDVAVRVDLGGA